MMHGQQNVKFGDKYIHLSLFNFVEGVIKMAFLWMSLSVSV
jgi:hypothetical protein